MTPFPLPLKAEGGVGTPSGTFSWRTQGTVCQTFGMKIRTRSLKTKTLGVYSPSSNCSFLLFLSFVRKDERKRGGEG